MLSLVLFISVKVCFAVRFWCTPIDLLLQIVIRFYACAHFHSFVMGKFDPVSINIFTCYLDIYSIRP